MSISSQEIKELERMWVRLWRTTVILGAIMLALGIFALVNPQATASLPIQLLGVVIILDGLFRLATAVWRRHHNSGRRFVWGLAEIIWGLLIFALATEIVTVALTFILYLVGIGLLISGGVSIVHVFQRRREWTGILTGALLLGLGVLMFALTGPLAISLVWVTGIFLTGVGVLLMVMGFRLRQRGNLLAVQEDGVVVEGQVIDGDIIEGEIVPNEAMNDVPGALTDGRDADDREAV